MWNIGLFNTFNMCQRRPASDRRLEGIEIELPSLREDLDPPIRQIRCPSTNAQPIGAPLREPPEPDPLHAPGNDPADGPLAPLTAPARASRPGAGSIAAPSRHDDAARRFAFQT